MGILSELGRLARNLFDLVSMAIGALIAAAIWAVGFLIDLFTDITQWINEKLEYLKRKGASEVYVISGKDLAPYIEEAKKRGNYTETTLDQLNALKSSVINVAMGRDGEIVEEQMIRSQGGMSANTRKQFQGKPILEIKI